LQVPPEQVSVLVESHTLHDPPQVPHVAGEFALQTEPEQHPFAHEVASQTHAPLTHRCPLAHAAPPPQEQPPAVQPSATVVLQVVHPLPLAPQEVTPAVSQVVPLQQPVAHDVASHTHAPPTQCCPLAHAAPVPHAQVPPDEQESARTGSHATQATPPAPHARAVVGELQVLPVQHPVHVLAQVPHAPLLQSSPDGQGVQEEPPRPHAVASGLVLQLLLELQHPLAHDVASHTHAPPTQCWPAAHGAPVPHAQLPPAQVSARTESQATQAEPVAPLTPHWPAVAT
jgi:hypothetical protein